MPKRILNLQILIFSQKIIVFIYIYSALEWIGFIFRLKTRVGIWWTRSNTSSRHWQKNFKLFILAYLFDDIMTIWWNIGAQGIKATFVEFLKAQKLQ